MPRNAGDGEQDAGPLCSIGCLLHGERGPGRATVDTDAGERGLRVRLLLADDHHLVREALSYYLRRTTDGLEVEEAATLDEALCRADNGRPFDAVILDLRMPGMNGLLGLDQMLQRLPGVPVVILSGVIGRAEAMDALKRGAAGVISKELRGPALINALRLVLAGETFVPSTLVDEPPAAEAALEGESAQRAALGNLTRRELEAVRLLADGLSNRDIAAAMTLAEVTVKLHLHNAFQKMGARSRADAVRIALRKGIAGA
jgi:two-component system, NarL family, nitrate/nitrite response regulator NarL